MSLKHRLNRAWRLFGTGLAFASFGLGGVLLSLSLFPLIRLTSPDRETTRRRIQRAMHYTFRLFLLEMSLLGLMSFEVQGRERLRRSGGRLVVANHPSLIDVVLLIALLPEADCIVKQGLWRNPFLRWPVVWADYLPNSDSAEELVVVAAANLRAGRSLIVFPEGTRSRPEQPLVMQRGAARIALAAGVEILPVTIVCAPNTLAKNQPWYDVPPRPAHWRLAVGEPLLPAAYAPHGIPEALAARRLTQHFVEHFAREMRALAAAPTAPETALAANATMG